LTWVHPYPPAYGSIVTAVPTVTPSSELGRLPIETDTPAKLASGNTDCHSASAAVTAASNTGSVNGFSDDAGGPRPLPGTAAASSGARVALESVVAPSVGGGVIESELVVLAGSIPTRDVPLAATDPATGARTGAWFEPDVATTEPRSAGMVDVVASGAGSPATTSTVLAPALDEPADDVTTLPAAIEAEIAELVCVLVPLV
jgi:hypothetical protein